MSTLPLSSTPRVCCVVLNWNGREQTADCVRSLLVQDYASLSVMVVDNGSTDNSVSALRSEFPGIEVVESGGNLGFARGNNVGLRRAYAEGFDYVWLLNNDTICPPDTCTQLVRTALAHPEAGLIGSVLRYMHAPERVQSWGGGDVDVVLGRSRHFDGRATLSSKSYLTFASVMIPRSVLERVGVLFEGIFMYWEDSDYSLRVTKAGYSLVVAEQTAILHMEGGSSGKVSEFADRSSAVGGLWFLRRHSPIPVLSQIWFIATRLAARALRRQPNNIRAVWAAVGEYDRQRKTAYSDRL